MPMLIPASGSPVGVVKEWHGAALPVNFLWCDGGVYNVADYPVLGALLGSRYGGDGVATFGVPDKRGRVAVGRDDMGGTAANRITSAAAGFDGATLGAVGGAQTHTLSSTEMPSHSHTLRRIEAGSVDSWSVDLSYTDSGDGSPVYGETGYSGSGGAHRNVQPSIISNFIIKAR